MCVTFHTSYLISTFTGKDFWTGGLNPGLLWIWSNSARPVASNSTANPSNNNNIKGNGRCLKLAYNPTLRGYEYQGSECSVRASYICEYEENSTSRALERIQKSLQEKFYNERENIKSWNCWNIMIVYTQQCKRSKFHRLKWWNIPTCLTPKTVVQNSRYENMVNFKETCSMELTQCNVKKYSTITNHCT